MFSHISGEILGIFQPSEVWGRLMHGCENLQSAVVIVVYVS